MVALCCSGKCSTFSEITMTQIFLIILFTFFLLVISATFIFQERSKKIQLEISQLIPPTLHRLKTTESLKDEHYKLAWSGENPFLVMALSTLLHAHLGRFESVKAQISDYYGQTKHLLKKKQVLDGIYFFFMSMKLSREACVLIRKGWAGSWQPIDLEVLGAPYFALSKIPLLGIFAKPYAVEPLLCGLAKIEASPPAKKKEEALSCALIASKLWAITKNDDYRTSVKESGLVRSHDMNQLDRVAKNLGMTRDQLFVLCGI